MTAQLPTNAEAIVRARLKGFKPADMVIVSMVGPVETENPIVLAKSGVSYDWRWARGLDVCMYLRDDADWPDTLLAIAKARPEHLNLWNHADGWGASVYLIPTAQDVERPVNMWRYELDFLPWMDFQNRDFIERRQYARDNNGVPYAAG